MRVTLLVLCCAALVACDDPPAPAASASAAATQAKPPPPKPSAAPTQSAAADDGSGAPQLPGTPLKDTLKGVDIIMGLGKASGPMGVMASDKKDVAAILNAIGTDQPLKKAFGSKCITPTKLAFQDKDKKALGVLGFCDTDDKFETGRFDGPGAVMVEVTVKDPAGLKTVLKKIGAIK